MIERAPPKPGNNAKPGNRSADRIGTDRHKARTNDGAKWQHGPGSEAGGGQEAAQLALSDPSD